MGAELARARYQPAVARLVMPAPGGSAKNWAAYKARFIEPRRIGAGLAWWRAHASRALTSRPYACAPVNLAMQTICRAP